MKSLTKDIKNALEQLPKLSPKKRLDFIINHKTPLKLVRSIPAPELLMTIKELGAESSLELVEMMHPEQIRDIFDLELWPSDKIDINRAGQYFSLLFAANKETAISQLHALDIELIGLLFKMVADIYDQSVGEEPVDYPELYSVTPDGRFIVAFKDKSGFMNLSASLHSFLEELYGRDLPFVLRLLESVRFELPSLLEEESYRWRQNRLLDLGILPREERLKYFAPLSKEQLKEALNKPPVHLEQQSTLPVASFDVSVGDRYPFLKHALSHSKNSIREIFKESLVSAALNIHASLSGDFSDREKIKETAEYVKFLIELGLMQASVGNIAETAKLLEKTSIVTLIRFAKTTLLGLRKRLLTNAKDFDAHFTAADSPLREVAVALNLPEPRYYVGLLDPKKLNVRYFSNINEVNATLHAVNELIFRSHFVAALPTDEKKNLLSHSALTARYLINTYLRNKGVFTEINDRDLKNIFTDQKLSCEFQNFARKEAEKIAQNLTEEEQRKAANFITTILIQLEQNPALLCF